jgi:hypothetical protein
VWNDCLGGDGLIEKIPGFGGEPGTFNDCGILSIFTYSRRFPAL